MGKIKILSEGVVNQIAAGEVAESPAAVVKELVENALDAQAAKIVVRVQKAGLESVVVQDNGCGMSKEDAVLSIKRHATSKVESAADLFSVSSLGFRGEALASIAAVAGLELYTSQDTSAAGFFLESEAGKILREGSLGFPTGTKVVVRHLFFNTPARRKFLRSERTEWARLKSIFLKLALSHPKVRFELIHNNKTSVQFEPAETFEQRVLQWLGPPVADQLLLVQHREEHLSFNGLFSMPEFGQPNRQRQCLFVNGRYVQNPGLQRAIYQGYQGLLMRHQNPMFWAQFWLAADKVDINIHPSKAEVRFQNTALVQTIVAGALSQKLRQQSKDRLLTGRTLTTRVAEGVFPASVDTAVQLPPMAQTFEEPAEPSISQRSKKPELVFNQQQLNLFANEQGAFVTEADQPLRILAIGQIDKFILGQADTDLIIVDKHAAHERVLYEQLRQDYAKQKIATILLEPPAVINLLPQEGVLLEHSLDTWQALGFKIESYGQKDYLLRQIPALLAGKNLAEIIHLILTKIMKFDYLATNDQYFQEVFSQLACRSAIRGNHAMSLPEIQKLLDDLTQLDIALYCPHGRPVLQRLASNFLDRMFKRTL